MSRIPRSPATSGRVQLIRQEGAGASANNPGAGSSLRPPPVSGGVTPDKLYPSIRTKGRNPTPTYVRKKGAARINPANQILQPPRNPRVISLTQTETNLQPRTTPVTSVTGLSKPSRAQGVVSTNLSRPGSSGLARSKISGAGRTAPPTAMPTIPRGATGGPSRLSATRPPTQLPPRIMINAPEIVPKMTRSALLRSQTIAKTSLSAVRSALSGASVASSRMPSPTRQIRSTTAVTTTDNKGLRKTYNTQESATVPKVRASTSGRQEIAQRKAIARPTVPPPSELRKQVARNIRAISAKSPRGTRVIAKGTKISVVPSLPKIETPRGREQVVQQIVAERRVERTRRGELVSRNLTATEMQDRGLALQFEMETQQLNPDIPPPAGAVKETVTFIRGVKITPNHASKQEDVIHEVTKLDPNLGIDPVQVSQLVEEEKEDVQNTLKISPPDLIHSSPEKYALKKRLQSLRLNSENMAFLEQSVIHPPVTGDEAQAETTPEIMAALMESAEKGVFPDAPPVQVFNTLFTEAKDDTVINISSVTPGPLGDVVIPTTLPIAIHEEVLNKEMEQVSVLVHTDAEVPHDGSFSETAPKTLKRKPETKKGRKKKVTLITDQAPPWGVDELTHLVENTGALPKAELEASNVVELSVAGNLEDDLSQKGIEYILNADPIQYYSRVQLRGSQWPSWFSGYMYALPDLNDVVEVAKSPSQVLHQAWKAVQPDVFGDDSIVYN